MSNFKLPQIPPRRGSALPRRTTAFLVVVVALAGGATAYAVTRSNGDSGQAFLNDVASRLHVSPQQLSSAFRAAEIDRVQAAVAAGRLTQAQANAIEQRIREGRIPFGPRLDGRHGHLRLELLSSAAHYLGLTPQQLVGQLRAGKSLAQIASAHGKSTAGLKSTLIAAVRQRLDRAVANGRITRAQEQKAISRLSSRLDGLISRSGLFRGGLGPRPGGRGPGAPDAGDGRFGDGPLPPTGAGGPPPGAPAPLSDAPAGPPIGQSPA